MPTFRAVRYTNRNTPPQIEQDTLPDLVLPTEVLIKVRCAALNPVDLLLRNYLWPLLHRSKKGMAFDYSGVVAAAGAKTSFKEGDRVSGLYQELYGRGTLAEYILVDSAKKSGWAVRKTPDGLSDEEAAAFPLVSGTAVSLFEGVAPGNKMKKLLILGGGTTVGKAATQLAKNVHNVETVYVTCSEKLAKTAKALGADKCIDYTKGNVAQQVKAAAAEQKFDAVFDCAGSSELFSVMGDVLVDKKEGGSYLTVSGDYKYSYTKPELTLLVWANLAAMLRALGSATGIKCYKYAFVHVNASKTWVDKVALYVAEGKLKVSVDSVFPFEKFADALERMGSNKATGKVVVRVSE